MAEGLSIEFTNPYLSFFPGQEVVGNLILRQSKEKKCEEIILKIEGKAVVKWTENKRKTVHNNRNRHQHRQTEVVSFYAEEKYFETTLYLLSGNDKSLILPAGVHIYPFQFLLPHNLPSSFEGEFGRVSYILEGRVRRPMFKFDDKIYAPITINALLDLNIYPGINLPIERSQSKSVCCLFCASGPIVLTAKLPRNGYVAGENLRFFVEVVNNSSRKIGMIYANFVQTVKFFARGKSKNVEKKMFQISGPSVNRGESEIWDGNFRIPSIPCSKLGNCRIIEVDYILRFEASIEGSLNLYTDVPLLIGSIPLRSVFNQLNSPNNFLPILSPPMPSTSSSSNRNSEITGAFTNEYPDLPPPTYEEAISQEKFEENLEPENINDENAGNFAVSGEFKPRYVIYG